MTPENAQKCHDGTKTQMRRVVKLPPAPNHLGQWEPTTIGGPNGGKDRYGNTTPEEVAIWHTRNASLLTCPYGLVGDRLWVREALSRNGSFMTYYDGSGVMQGELSMPSWCERKKIPPIHMPRWACRTVLEITEVRVERLKEISDADALAEGVTVRPDAEIAAQVAGPPESGARMEYFALWESIHGAGSWGQNPWVWVISFKKVG